MNNISEILSVYERTIYGDLRPWIPDNLNENKFTEFLHPSIEVIQPVQEEFIKALEAKIKEHPLFADVDFCEIEVNEETNELKIANPEKRYFDDLIDISIPPSFNDKTEYYYLILKLTNGNILKNINEIFTNSTSNEDFSFFINKLFGRLKLIINETHLKLKSINYDKILEAPLEELSHINQQKKIDHYILYAVKERLIQLMLEIHSFYNDYFNREYLTDRRIYHEILHDHYPPDSFYLKMHKLEIFSIQNLLKRLPDYSLDKVHSLINRNKQCLANLGGYTRITEELTTTRSSLLANILILENLIFYQLYINDGTTLNVEILSNNQITSNWYNIHKSFIQEKLKEISSSIDAVDFLKELQISNKLLFTDVPLHHSVQAKTSTIRRLDDWLSEQINFYKANLSLSVGQLQHPNSEKVPTNLSAKELAFLFRTLYDLKIVQPKTKTELYKFIANNFTTKGTDELSWNSIKNHFESPEYKAADLWATNFTQLMQLSKKIRENI